MIFVRIISIYRETTGEHYRKRTLPGDTLSAVQLYFLALKRKRDRPEQSCNTVIRQSADPVNNNYKVINKIVLRIYRTRIRYYYYRTKNKRKFGIKIADAGVRVYYIIILRYSIYGTRTRYAYIVRGYHHRNGRIL